MSDAQLMTLFVEPSQDHESPPPPAILSLSFSSFDPFDGIEWETRESILADDTGRDTLSKGMVTVPRSFSANASDVLCSKYLRRRGVPNEVSPVSRDLFSPSIPKEGSSFGGETDLRQAIHRMAGCWAHWGIRSGLLSPVEASTLYLDASFLLARQCWAPNSPQWFNTGLFWAYGISGPSSGHFFAEDGTGIIREATRSYERPQPHACFIQSVGDDLVGDGGIMDLWVREARLFKFGSGTGTNFSGIRAKGELLSGGGQSSGLMSWLKIGDRSAAGIQSGGTTRRAAKMVILDVDHPEIESFVTWKAKEEQKVAALVTGSRANRRVTDQIWSSIQDFQPSMSTDRFDPTLNRELKKALFEGRKLGVPDKVMARAIEFAKEGKKFDPQTFDLDWRGEAYDSVSGQQSNNSVSISHSFMEKVFSDQDWSLVSRTTGSVVKHLSASGLYDQICESAWVCADPGVQFVDTMNEWNTVAGDGKIKATNPCSEYVFLDDTACNLASINLARFWTPDGGFDLKAFESAVRLVTTILEISVSMASLPSEAIAKGTWLYRTLGLGYANLGALLMQMGVPYDSEEGRRIGAAITSFMTAVAYDQSGIMASKVGPFPRWAANKDHMTRVLENHRRASLGLPLDRVTHCPPPLDNSVSDRASRILRAASSMWSSALTHAETHGYRNAQVTCIAPTGTIAIEMDCDTTGIEPDFALVKHKTLAGGGFMKIVNRSVPQALRSLGYDEGQIDSICTWILGSGSFSQKMEQMLFDKLPADTVLMLRDRVLVCNNIWAVFLPDVIGRTVLSEAGIDPNDVAGGLGLTESFLREENLYVFGRQTLEGCPILSPEHLPVFDCAGRCGIGVRSIRPEGHLLMLAAVQPFLSGAASKTVNLPSSATSRDVREVYSRAWKLGVKCVALYVDGSKFSQPLSSGVAEKMFGSLQDLDLSPDSPDHAKVVQQIVEKVSIKYISERRKLPHKRRGYTQKVMIGNHKFFLRTGEYPDGSLGEIFVDTHKDGTAFKSLMGAFAIAVSVGLQHGVPLERFVDLFTFVKFEPNGPVAGDDRLMMCTSLLDWIFRHLAVNYLNRDDLATVPKDDSAFDPKTIGEGESNIGIEEALLDGTESGGCLSTEEVLLPPPPSGSLVIFSGEYCDACGQFSLVRKGRCTSCSNPACRAETGGCG